MYLFGHWYVLSGVFGVGLSPITAMMQNYLRSNELGIVPGQRGNLAISKVREGFEQISRVPSSTREPPKMWGALQSDADHLGPVMGTLLIWGAFVGVFVV